MVGLGVVTIAPRPPQAHDHKRFVNPCHEALKPASVSIGDGSMIVELTASGRQRAADIIRRHRLAERLFTDSLAIDRKSTRLNSSHLVISYAVFCLKKKTKI